MAHRPNGILVNVKLVMLYRQEVLLITYPDRANDVPGGHVEFGETVLAALRREVREEIGFDLPTKPVLSGVYNDLRPGRSIHRITIAYRLVLNKRPNVQWREKDRIKLAWHPLSTLSPRRLKPDYIYHMIHDAAASLK